MATGTDNGNDCGSCCLSCKIVAQFRLSRAIDGRRRVSRILFYRECARLQFIGTTDDAPRIYWSWSPLPCLASTSLSSGSLNFFAHLHRDWAGHSHFLRTLFWPVCDVAFKGSPDFVNLSRDSFRI